MSRTINKVLIANRGEIACRVIDTCRRLGIHTIAVYSQADATARHVRLADEALCIGQPAAAESYLNTNRILDAARAAHADAVHPGYGFLSENADFARAAEKAGFIFIGPTADTIDIMGSKSRAKALMEKADVPVVPGYHGDKQNTDFLQKEAGKIGWPILIKPVAGGGGKGMHIVRAAKDFATTLATAQRESKGAFGNATVLLEKYIERPRHIEMQIFGDSHGHAVHLFERECTLQRRYQKVIEETPSPFLDEATQTKMAEAAVNAAKAVDYIGAGTVEFIVSPDRDFYFMEMNTRLQVEHPITEMTTGIDLVEWQIAVASGEPLPLEQSAITRHGHAIEARLYAENAARDFVPVTGTIERFIHPQDHNCFRTDTGVEDGDDISIHYDPMIAKLSVWGHDRHAAVTRLQSGLNRTAVFGLTTNLDLLQGIAAHPDFAKGQFDTGFIERELDTLLASQPPSLSALAAASAWVLDYLSAQTTRDNDPWTRRDGWQLNGKAGIKLLFNADDDYPVRVAGTANHFSLYIDDHCFTVAAGQTTADCWFIRVNEYAAQVRILGHKRTLHIAVGDERQVLKWVDPLAGVTADTSEDTRPISPMPGHIVAVNVAEGDSVEPGQPLLVLEGMKMEYTLKASTAGTITKLLCAQGDRVEAETPLVEIDAATADN